MTWIRNSGGHVLPRAAASLYFTTFPLTEATISEGGNWTNPASATWTNPVATASGRAYGPASSASNDSIAMLSGPTLPSDYTITCVVYGAPSGAAEIEILGRCSSANSSDFKCYEIDIVPSLSLVGIAKWMGGQGVIAGGNYVASATPATIVAGQIWKAVFSGANVKVYQSGTPLIDFTDVNSGGTGPYLSGPPGIGFDAGNPTDGAAFGWDSYRVDP